jgi:hypothetical protein
LTNHKNTMAKAGTVVRDVKHLYKKDNTKT